MKPIIILIIILSCNLAGAQNRLGDIELESAAKAMQEERYKDAVEKYTKAEKLYSNNSLKIPGIRREKVIAQDKLFNLSKKDTIQQYDLLVNCESFLEDYNDSNYVTEAQLKEVYEIWDKNEMEPERRERIRTAKDLQKPQGQKEQESEKEDENGVESKDSTVVEENKKLKQELSKFKKGENQNIGTFELLTKKVFVKNLNDSVTIDSVDVEIKDGFIRNFRVFTSHGNEKKYFITRRPISLIRFYKSKDVKVSLPSDKYTFFTVGEVLDYIPVRANNFTPDNNDFTIKYSENIKERKHVIKTNEGLSNFIDYRVYSDFLGLIGEASNGIVNFEASACIPVMPSNIENENIYLIKCLKPNFRYSRFDKQDRAIQSDPPVEGSTFFKLSNKLDILQNSFISGGFSFDVLTIDPFSTVFELNIPFKVNFNLTEADLTQPNDAVTTKENITSTNYGGGLELKFSRTNNFGMTLYGYFFEVRHHYSENRRIDQIKPFPVYNTGAELFFYNRKDQTNSAVFLRFNYISEIKTSNNFFQMQIGYKSTLDL